MGQIITTGTQATTALEILCPSAADPALDVDDMASLLDGAQRATIWIAATSYDFSAVIMPTVRNGRRYRLISFDGTGTSSGTTEPSWPHPNAVGATGNYPVWGQVLPNPVVGWWRNAIITDGNLTWMEDGDDYDSLWDIGRAAYAGWLLKASRVVCAIDINTGKTRMEQSKIYDHCVSQAQRYAPVYVA